MNCRVRNGNGAIHNLTVSYSTHKKNRHPTGYRCVYFSGYWLRGQELRPALWHCTIVFLVLAAAGLQGCHNRTKIILEYHDINCRRGTALRHGVRKKSRAPIFRPVSCAICLINAGLILTRAAPTRTMERSKANISSSAIISAR